ncbi:hypothetical protein Salat_1011300 [Sesamum alatum]|uniref:Uncharacterized protein n=1 Tax=Sesamum alatum TaxID=300844 RepID=A0AAE1YLZ9_9LAMI|nr:hypothetical protein Salat_1011300 [Sesamum alatum]
MVDLGFEINRAGDTEAELRANDVGPSKLNDAERVAGSLRRVRAREANGFVVYTRNKRFKRRSEGVGITEASSNGEGEFEMKEDEVAKIDGLWVRATSYYLLIGIGSFFLPLSD